MKILITGATSGIGRATANLLATKNHHLILTGRRQEKLEKLKRQLENEHEILVDILTFDVRNVEEVETALNFLPDQKIDVLVNNAGLAKGFSEIHEGNLQHWEQMIDTNIKGLLYVSRIVSKWMVKNKSGQIINICSVAGKEPYPNGNVYCATKHAVDALTKTMRIDLHKYNIRVGQVSPGHVEETEFALVRFDGDEERSKIYEDFQPLKSSDVAEIIEFMISRPPHVNIQDVDVFGTQQATATIVDRSGK
ncbi:SDR family NAD(P)-dependent oxidoreductase [Membranihabitans maritimus]|uniref:SDR family NAD(P)-dependent oxidoreductase n=1 Tax=Membranihabitans maritimus TaxID=2904244 RepID=UPI001F2D43E3|nr:SDR family NAD(P)-dependent oxidoreductase [Membranihabitans maritimus]